MDSSKPLVQPIVRGDIVQEMDSSEPLVQPIVRGDIVQEMDSSEPLVQPIVRGDIVQEMDSSEPLVQPIVRGDIVQEMDSSEPLVQPIVRGDIVQEMDSSEPLVQPIVRGDIVQEMDSSEPLVQPIVRGDIVQEMDSSEPLVQPGVVRGYIDVEMDSSEPRALSVIAGPSGAPYLYETRKVLCASQAANKEPQTSKKDYRNHKYSGPKKSRKRSLAQIKRYHGEPKSREEIWCKRNENMPSNSSEKPVCQACIIGKETKKCLYIGIKNKYCYHCHIYEKDEKPVPEHMCFKNYEGPSTAMESTILVEGFQKSQEMHGLKYLRFIGDGDSSVFAQLREKVSYGSQIRKIECKNHVVKNYTGALYKILANTKLPLLGRRILKPRLAKLTTVTRKIIIQGDKKTMREDLQNGPSHVFGSHTQCKGYYCRYVETGEEDSANNMVLSELKQKAPTVWALICAANESVMAKCHRLSNETTNVVENFMSIISKFICGKRLNLHKGGSYQRRVYVAGLSQCTGQKWHTSAWKEHTSRSPGKTFKKYVCQKIKNQAQRKILIRKRLFVPKSKAKPDKNYGPNAQEADETMPEDDLKKACIIKLQEFQKTRIEIQEIERQTVGQHENDTYNTYRSDRLTASQFGMICKRKSATPCHNHVKGVLYKNNVMTTDMAYGQQNESVGRTLFKEKTRKNVRQAGLFIDEEYGFLGASPDGVIEEENTILEIKCFPSLARNNQDMISAAKDRKNFPLYVDSSGNLQLNKKHNYYYQIQGQLRVTKMDKCYFVGYISPAYDITVIEIERDEDFISNMLPKLVIFFKNCILPELVMRRVRNNLKCLDVALWK